MQSKREVQNIDKNKPSTIYIYRKNTFLLATPVPSAGATPVPSAGATGQAGQADIQDGHRLQREIFFFSHPLLTIARDRREKQE